MTFGLYTMSLSQLRDAAYRAARIGAVATAKRLEREIDWREVNMPRYEREAA